MEQTVRLQQTAHSHTLNNNSDIHVFYFGIFKGVNGTTAPSSQCKI